MRDKDHKDHSVIGEDLVIDGNLSCKSDLLIEGNVEGNISCMSLYVGRTGKVTGDISSDQASIEGAVQGMIKSGGVELKDGCTLEGDIESQTLAMDHGAAFTGSVRPTKDASRAHLRMAAE